MMGTEGLSAGDILALTKDNDNGMSGAWNNPFIYLVWLALLGGNGGLFGNRNADAAVQGALTRSDLFEGFNNQDVNSQLRGITNGVCDGFYAINSGMKDGFLAIRQQSKTASIPLSLLSQIAGMLCRIVAAEQIRIFENFLLKVTRIPAKLQLPSMLKVKQLVR